MKKFWIVLIALGLVAAFSMPASALDVKFSGSYYIQGWYDNNHSLIDPDDRSVVATDTGRGSAALFHQRLRVQTDFKVAEGLTLTTRFDAMERNWGDRRERNLTPTVGTPSTAATVEVASRNYGFTQSSAATIATPSVQEQANIEFERVYITANLPFGQFLAGYYQDIAWGTGFLDTVTTRPAIGLNIPVGPMIISLKAKKDLEGTMYYGVGKSNWSDKDIYDLAFTYKWKSGEAGVLLEYLVNNAAKQLPTGAYEQRIWGGFPYFKTTLGPVFLEGEGYYGGGKFMKWESSGVDVDLSTWGLYLHAKVDLKPVYFGGMFVYMKGDDPSTADKREGSIAAGLVAGQAFTPALMLWNDPYYTAFGALGGRTAAADTIRLQFMDNTMFGQLYVGVKPTPKWDIVLKGSYAVADEKPSAAYEDDVIGTEFDLIATYKIYDNLSYMFGAGYLFTGDYFKGAYPNTDIKNNYMLMHQLTLTF